MKEIHSTNDANRFITMETILNDLLLKTETGIIHAEVLEYTPALKTLGSIRTQVELLIDNYRSLLPSDEKPTPQEVQLVH